MSYLVLARKYRPQSFDEVVGQQAVVRTLRNALSRKRVAHAMIFSGVRGVGKTTLARIMAKALSCESESTDPPCNECSSCREITAGTALDLHEVDGASNRGIQEIRELKENIRFLPTSGRYKIIIIDEVHMLTPEAFNALLKTLEEPPEHVIFMFATTELHKIPVTILSRCQRYELKRIPFVDLFSFFKKIAQSEKVNISDQALEMIAAEAEGSVRDGLSLLDQIFSFADDDNMTDKDVREVLGLVDRQIFASLASSLLAGELSGCLEILDQIYGAGVDLKRFTTDLLTFFRAIIVCKTSKNPENLLDVSDRELETLKEFAAANSPETLYRFFDLMLKGIEEMQYSPHPRLVLEMTFIKALQTGRIVPVSDLIGRIDGLLKNSDVGGQTPAAELPPVVPSVVESVTSSEPEPPPPPVAAPSAPVVEAKKKAEPVEDKPGAGIDSLHLRDVRKNWDEFIGYVKDRKPWMSHILKLGSGVRQEGVDLVVKFDDRSDCMVLQQAENIKYITEFAQDFFQQELHVKIKIRGADVGEEGEDADAPHEERRSLANDPLVQMTSEIFGGQVSGIRTGPRSR